MLHASQQPPTRLEQADPPTLAATDPGNVDDAPPATAPGFAVVITTMNRREYVLETIRSVVEQTYAPAEVVVVVDGGDDDTAAEVAATYPDVSLIEQANRGRSVARNRGIAASTAEWVCFLDDDDLWHRDKLAATAAYLTEHPDCRAVTHPCWFFSQEDQRPGTAAFYQRDFVAADLAACHARVAAGDPSTTPWDYLKIQGQSFARMLERNCGVLSASVVRRDVLIQAGGFAPNLTSAEDWLLSLNVARLTEWHTLPRRLVFMRMHPEQSTAGLENCLAILAGFVGVWYGGRPLPQRIAAMDVERELAAYGSVYRQTIQAAHWAALRSRRLRVARRIRQFAHLLLPRRRDLAYALTPPPLTWRAERYLLGMHR